MSLAIEKMNSILYSVNAVAEVESIVIPNEPKRVIALTLYDSEEIVTGRMIKEKLLFWNTIGSKGGSHAIVSVRP
jgi:hypothetical protein